MAKVDYYIFGYYTEQEFCALLLSVDRKNFRVHCLFTHYLLVDTFV